MKTIIPSLRRLNELDQKLHSIKKDLERIPKDLESKETDLRVQRDRLERRKAEVAAFKAEAKGLEDELEIGETALKRYNSQVNTLRTPKELETMRRQMDDQRRGNQRLMDRSLEMLSQAELKQKELDEATGKLAESEKAMVLEREKLAKDVLELKADQTKLNTERESITKDIPEKELSIYTRVGASKGVAIALVEKNGTCSSCSMKLPPQFHNEVLIGRELVTCPSCGRILTAE